DDVIKDLESRYETRIAELIVAHENRVGEVEGDANEHLQKELERVEMEFERDRKRITQEQAKKLADLQASHEVTIQQLEDQLTKAEMRVKEAVEKLKDTRKTHELEANEVKDELIAQATAVRNSIDELFASQEQGPDSGKQALEKGYATILGTERVLHELALSEVLVKEEAVWRAKNESLFKQVNSIRAQLESAAAERDKAHAAMQATETQLQEEYTSAVDGLHKEHKSRMEQQEEEARTRLDRMKQTHEEHTKAHESNLSGLLTLHHQNMQTLRDEHEAQLKDEEEEHHDHIMKQNEELSRKNEKMGAEMNQLRTTIPILA
ncbi:hypothetical protein BGZ65_010608, partial [Modicella reniformis]